MDAILKTLSNPVMAIVASVASIAAGWYLQKIFRRWMQKYINWKSAEELDSLRKKTEELHKRVNETQNKFNEIEDAFIRQRAEKDKP